MNAIQCGVILNRLSAALGGKEVPEEAVQVWTDLLGTVDPMILAEACDLYALENTYFPSVAQIRPYVAQVHRERAMEEQRIASEAGRGRNPGCSFCHGYGWGDVTPMVRANADGEKVEYDTVRPCASCDPIAYETWQEWKRSLHPSNKVTPNTTYEFNVADRIREAHEALDAKGTA